MRTFGDRTKATHLTAPGKASTPRPTYFKQSRDVHSVLHSLQTDEKNSSLRSIQGNVKEIHATEPTATSNRSAYDYSHIPMHAKSRDMIHSLQTDSAPENIYEREADLAAERVMRMPEPKPQSDCGGGADCPKRNEKRGYQENKCLQTKRIQTTHAHETAVPPIVQNVLSEPGHSFDQTTRNFMESRFNHDFSHVRVHTGAKAKASTKAMNALAYTVGRDIVLGAGQHAPNTQQGRRLLAHELTHVLQQGGNRSWVQQQAAPTAIPATNQMRRDFVQEAIQFLYEAARFYQLMTIDEARLIRTLDGLKSTVENNLDLINNFLGGDQGLQSRLRQAYRSAVSALVRRASQQLNQTTHEVYQTNRSRIHESGWPQAAQDTAAHSRTAALPEAERARLTVITTDFNLQNLHDLFSTRGARTTIPLPPRVTVSFGGRIPQGLQHGLRNVAGTLIPGTLPIDSTMTLALDLEGYGGDYGAYRFTFVEHRVRRGTPTREVIIERLGSIGIKGLTESQRRAQSGRFRQFGFQRGSGWSNTEFEALLTAIAQVPDGMLNSVSGLTFDRDTAHATNPSVGGDYDPETHTITLYDVGFAVSLTRFGTPGTTIGIQSNAVFTVVHEIGHAIDLLPLRRAWRNLVQAGEALHAAFQQFENPPGSRSYRFPSSQQANYNRLNQQITQARQALTGTRSVSGARRRQSAGVWETVESRGGGRNNAFRQAVRQDGATFPSNYPNPQDWWQEYFAESFSLYMNSPLVLQQLRPNVYDFFVANFPI